MFFQDYGNTDTVSVKNMKELREEFRSLPAQAVGCSLDGVKPSAATWSEDASVKFEDMVMEGEFSATVVAERDGR